MLKLAGEFIEGQVADHIATLDAHTRNIASILRTGEYITPTGLVVNTAGEAPGGNQLYAAPFFAVRDMTIDRIAIECYIAEAGKNVRLGIYNDGTNLYPGSLVLDAGTVSIGTTGVKAITINQVLTKGLYFFVLVTDATGTGKLRRLTTGQFCIGINASNFANMDATWRVAHTYGALPDPFTAGGSLIYAESYAILPRLASLD